MKRLLFVYLSALALMVLMAPGHADAAQTCPSFKNYDGSFPVCKGSTIEHLSSGLEVEVVSYRNRYLDVLVSNADQKRVRLAFDRPYVVTTDNGSMVTMIFEEKRGYRAMLRLELDRGLACENARGGDDLIFLCFGHSFSHQPSSVRASISRVSSRHLTLNLEGAHTAGIRLIRGRTVYVTGLDGSRLKLTYNRYFPDKGVYLYFSSEDPVPVYCGSAEGGNGMYTVCPGDRIFHNTGLNVTVLTQTQKHIVVLLNTDPERRIRLFKNRPRRIGKYEFTYHGITDGSIELEVRYRYYIR